MVPRIVGILLIATGAGLFTAPRLIAAWLGRPIGWGSIWESLRGTGPAGNSLYTGYRAYTFLAGWFWFIMLELILLAFGAYFLAAGKWL